MSTLKKKKWIVIILVSLSFLSFPVVAQEETDEILDYFQKRANEVFKARDPILSGVTFSFDVTIYRKEYDKQKKTKIIDSLTALYFYKVGKLEDIIIKTKPLKTFDTLDIEYPNIFNGDYHYNFYPNDTGGQEIAIGYDSDSLDTKVPIGIAIIDRSYYFLTQLYMYYMSDKKVERESKYTRFKEFEGLIFPDSIWEIKSRNSIFSTEYYKIETGICNIRIIR